MTGIDDLRATLTDHAHEVDGLAGVSTVDRRAAVQHRVGVTRRRRRAGAAGVLAAAVVAAGGAVLWTADQPEAGPAGPSVFGRDIPTQLRSLGYTYDYSQHTSGEGRVAVELPASDEPRLVSWATAGVDDVVRVTDRRDEQGTITHDAPDFTDWVLVEPGARTTVVVKGDGDVAVATYTLGDERPAGVTGAGVTYRDEIAGGRLLAATIGEPGQGEITVRAEADGPGLGLRYACAGVAGNNLVVHHRAVGDPGAGSSGRRCDEALPVDGVSDGGYDFSARAGEDVATRVWVTRGEDGPVVDDPRLRLTAALYTLDADPFTDAGAVPETTEYDGHRWRLVQRSQGDLSSRPADTGVPEGQGTVYVVVAMSTSLLEAKIEHDLYGESQSYYFGRGLDTTLTGIVPSGGPVRIQAVDGTDPTKVDLQVGYYVRAD